jgi:TRAP-type mannitol/chloroaromatic compound transport system permease small subunit
MKKIINFLESITRITGTTSAWLTLIMVLAASVVVILRKAFDIGLIGLQEAVTYKHAIVFMSAAAWALQRGAHVRVDIFYRRFSKSTQAWVDIIGSLFFTLPLMIFIGIGSWDFVRESWRIQEGSTDSGGLAFVFILKSLLPLMAFTVCLQALADIARNVCFLMNLVPNLITNPE